MASALIPAHRRNCKLMRHLQTEEAIISADAAATPNTAATLALAAQVEALRLQVVALRRQNAQLRRELASVAAQRADSARREALDKLSRLELPSAAGDGAPGLRQQQQQQPFLLTEDAAAAAAVYLQRQKHGYEALLMEQQRRHEAELGAAMEQAARQLQRQQAATQCLHTAHDAKLQQLVDDLAGEYGVRT